MFQFSPDITSSVPHHRHYALEISENCSPMIDHCRIKSTSVGKYLCLWKAFNKACLFLEYQGGQALFIVYDVLVLSTVMCLLGYLFHELLSTFPFVGMRFLIFQRNAYD